LGTVTISRHVSITLVTPVRLYIRSHGTRLPLHRSSRNFIFEIFSKLCQENSSFKRYFTWRYCTFM